jgi:hypothetical protein
MEKIFSQNGSTNDIDEALLPKHSQSFSLEGKKVFDSLTSNNKSLKIIPTNPPPLLV